MQTITALVTYNRNDKCKFVHFTKKIQWAVEVVGCTPQGVQDYKGTFELWFPVPKDCDLFMMIEQMLIKHRVAINTVYIECINTIDHGDGSYCDDLKITYNEFTK